MGCLVFIIAIIIIALIRAATIAVIVTISSKAESMLESGQGEVILFVLNVLLVTAIIVTILYKWLLLSEESSAQEDNSQSKMVPFLKALASLFLTAAVVFALVLVIRSQDDTMVDILGIAVICESVVCFFLKRNKKSNQKDSEHESEKPELVQEKKERKDEPERQSEEELRHWMADLKKKLENLQRQASNWKLELEKIDQMSGEEFEKKCVELLRKRGWVFIRQIGGSGDQGVDIIAIKHGVKYAIQCKRYKNPIGNTPIQEVYAGKAFHNCKAALVITNSHFTNGGKELAKKIDVELWDRETLIQILKGF